ncbi:hypothetical protein [Oceanobacillus sp. Castelsardo]|uniref:hypothetical protein n=1 Tax=Oceanobacillus sp. Castelsardo TaxID=1851204 RepID=UPI000B1F72C1|nr:hypothetical protein [Oceanobacillus sp. Castelsardo]
MSKTDKELAVEIAKAYIEASSNLKQQNGASKPIVKPDEVLGLIKDFHAELKKLD